jgi:hypothetical protein
MFIENKDLILHKPHRGGIFNIEEYIAPLELSPGILLIIYKHNCSAGA